MAQKPSDFFEFDYFHDDFPFNVALRASEVAENNDSLCGIGIYSIFDKIDNSTLVMGLKLASHSNAAIRLGNELEALTLRGRDVSFGGHHENSLDGLFAAWDSRTGGNTQVEIGNDELREALQNNPSITEDEMRLMGWSDAIAKFGHRRFAADNWNEFGAWGNEYEVATGMDNRFYLQFDQLHNLFPDDLPEEMQLLTLRLRFLEPLLKAFNPKCDEGYRFNDKTIRFAALGKKPSGPTTLSMTLSGINRNWDSLRNLELDNYLAKFNEQLHAWRTLNRLELE